MPKRPGADPLGTLAFDDACRLAATAFLRLGVDKDSAQGAAEILVLAEAMGISTHGLNRVGDYKRRIDAGSIDAKGRPTVRMPAPALCHIDGHDALGPVTARCALDAAMDAARVVGVGAAFVRGGSHLGALAPYLFIAAEAGFAAVMTSNTAPMIAPAGGTRPRIGNNPLGFAIPDPEGQHVLVDMALSVVARSRVRAASKDNAPIPEAWATDAEGHPTTDATLALQGMMRAIGGDKGANLALCLDLMAGGLSGALMLSDIPNAAAHPERPQNLGQMFILIDAARLLAVDDRAKRMDHARRIIADTPAVDPAQKVRMPGARALSSLKDARENGLTLSQDLISELETLAGK